MNGPWEKYQSDTATIDQHGPWDNYKPATAGKQIPTETPIISQGKNIAFDPTGKTSTTYGGPPTHIAPMSEAVEYAKQAATQQLVSIPEMTIKPDDSVASAVGKEAYNLAASIPNFMATPIGIGATAAGGAIPRTVSGIFSAIGFKSVGESILNTYKDWNQMTRGQKAAALTAIGGGSVFSSLMAKMAVKPFSAAKRVAPQTASELAKAVEQSNVPHGTPVEQITAAAVKTPEGVVTAANHPTAEAAAGMPETAREERNTPQYGYETTERPFVTRPEAKKVAEQSGQLLKEPETPGQPHSDEISAKPGGTTPLAESNVPVKNPTVARNVEFKQQARNLSTEELVAKRKEAIKSVKDLVAQGKIQEATPFIQQAQSYRELLEERGQTVEQTSVKPSAKPPKPEAKPTAKEPAAAPGTTAKLPGVETEPNIKVVATGKTIPASANSDEVLNEYTASYKGKKTRIFASSNEDANTQAQITFTGKVSDLTESKQSPIETLNTAKQVKITAPKEATMVRVTDSAGKTAIQDLKSVQGENVFQGAGIKKIEAGTIGSNKKFIPVKGQVKIEPQMIGMGAAKTGEVEAGAGADVYGIAQRIREERAKSGQTVSLAPGEGVSDVEAIRHGQELLAKDHNAADNALVQFTKSKSISYDALAAVRAKGESAFRSARRVEEKFGTASPEYLDALENAVRWDKASKEMQTEWHKTGMAQQSATDIDTGSVIGLETDFRHSTGRNFTPGERAAATRIVEKGKVAITEYSDSLKKYTEQMELGLKDIDVPSPKNAEQARLLFSKFRSGQKMTPQQIKTVWEYAKKFYLDRGETDFGNIRHGVAKDLGIEPEDVTRALTQPKFARPVSAEMYRKAAQVRRLREGAKWWVNQQKYPRLWRWLMRYPRLRFSMAVFGHALVPFGTHAPIEFFKPWSYPRLVSDYFKMAKMAFNTGYHERMMQDLEHAPRYWFWRQNGAQIDITRPMEEYAEPGLVTKLQSGSRAFDILKILRYQKLEHDWGKLPEHMQTRDMAKLLSDMANHSTGVVKALPVQGKLGRLIQVVEFAPRLIASRFAWTVGDTAKATGILSRKVFGGGKNITPEEMTFAKKVFGERAAVAAVYYSYLQLNNAYLNATNSKQKINFTNPHRADWLAFKVGGYEVRPWSPEVTLIRDALGVLAIGVMPETKFQQLQGGRGSRFGDTALGWARGTLSPAAQDIPDFYTRKTITGQYLPTFDENVPLRDRRKGVEPMTWGEYGLLKASPIPVSETTVPAYHLIRSFPGTAGWS